MDYALGIDVGATNVKAAAVTPAGDVLRRDCFETRDGAAPTWPEEIQRYVQRVSRERGEARWIGVACPGLAARDGRTIAWMQGRMAAVQGFDWTRPLGRTDRVPVLNDGHAALLGETWLGAGIGAKNVVLLTLGTGVGGAVMCDGKLLRGAIGRAGHIGHMSLNPNGPVDIVGTPGSLEDAVGDCTIRARSGGRFASTVELLESIKAGDENASRIWADSIRALAAGIASIINCVDPELVILGGGICGAGTMLTEPLARRLDEIEWRPLGDRVRIVLATLGEHAGALGAARNAMQV
jgi:glucokinase